MHVNYNIHIFSDFTMIFLKSLTEKKRKKQQV